MLEARFDWLSLCYSSRTNPDQAARQLTTTPMLEITGYWPTSEEPSGPSARPFVRVADDSIGAVVYPSQAAPYERGSHNRGCCAAGKFATDNFRIRRNSGATDRSSPGRARLSGFRRHPRDISWRVK